MSWKKYEFKGEEVYVRVLPAGKPIVHRGRVELRYRLGASKSYKAAPENITDIDGEVVTDEDMGGSSAGAVTGKAALQEQPKTPPDENTIIIYTDGACSGNPGPAGIGVFLQRPESTLELSEYIGSGTNNIAELTAILRGLERITEAEQATNIHLYTDSGWSLGVLIGGWKAKANLEIIAAIKVQMARLPNLELLKIKGHAGHPGNEEADRLATQAARRESSAEPRERATKR
jgi:ribonuclease HI